MCTKKLNTQGRLFFKLVRLNLLNILFKKVHMSMKMSAFELHTLCVWIMYFKKCSCALFLVSNFYAFLKVHMCTIFHNQFYTQNASIFIECLQIKDKARKERIFKINQILMTKTKKIVKIIEISNLFMKCKIANKTKYDKKAVGLWNWPIPSNRKFLSKRLLFNWGAFLQIK